jgi:hypothetical protein
MEFAERTRATSSHDRACSCGCAGAPLIQAELLVGRSDDPMEREADRVADAVMQRMAGVQALPGSVDAADPGRVRRMSTTVRRTAGVRPAAIGPAGGPVDGDTARRVQRATGSGSPLDAATRQRMDGAFGADFSGVRIHRGAESDDLNRSLGARAFTTGAHVFLGQEAPAIGTAGGDRLLAHELTHTLQQGGAIARTASDAPQVSARIQRSSVTIQRDTTVTENPLFQKQGVGGTNPLYQGPVVADFPKVGDVKGEAIIFEKDGDEFEATVILNNIETSYGVSVRSDKLAKAIPTNYKKAPKDVRAAVAAGVWQMKELRAIERALAHFAPILGAARKDSARKGAQEVKYIGKVKKAIDENSKDGELDSTTMGEYFKKQKTLGLFDAGTNSTEDFTDNLKQLEGTAVHEMAHGLFGYMEKAWVNEFDFWENKYDDSGKAGAEAPPSEYGKTNAAEDLCESVMFYFVDENRLKTSAPLRHAFVDTMVKAWKKEQKSGSKGAKKK